MGISSHVVFIQYAFQSISDALKSTISNTMNTCSPVIWMLNSFHITSETNIFFCFKTSHIITRTHLQISTGTPVTFWWKFFIQRSCKHLCFGFLRWWISPHHYSRHLSACFWRDRRSHFYNMTLVHVLTIFI